MSWLIKVSYNIRYEPGEFMEIKETRLIKKATTFVGAVNIFTRWTKKQTPVIVHINDIGDLTIKEE